MAQPTWKDLFISVGIKDDAAEKYAEIFDQQRMSRETLVMLDRQTLTELGITVIGDALSILRLAKSVETQATTSQSVFARTPSAKLPTLSSQMTHPQFRKFSMDWKVFVDITGLPPSQHHTMLYSCGDDEVQTAIINMYPDFFELPADTLLGKIEQVVTEKSNPTVHRMNFHNLMQENLETVQNYTIRLKSAAKDCEFSCPSKLQRWRSFLTVGLQSALPGTGTCHRWAWPHPSEIQAVRLSTYRRNKASGPKPTAAQNRPAQIHEPYASRASQQRSCSGCGSKTHSNRDRATACPAWGKTCDQCHKVNHFARVCRSNQAAAREITDYDEIATLMACIYSPDDASCGQVTTSKLQRWRSFLTVGLQSALPGTGTCHRWAWPHPSWYPVKKSSQLWVALLSHVTDGCPLNSQWPVSRPDSPCTSVIQWTKSTSVDVAVLMLAYCLPTSHYPPTCPQVVCHLSARRISNNLVMLHLLRDHRSQSLIPNPVHDHSHNALPRSLTRHHRTTSLNWKRVLQCLHSAHQGVTSMRARANCTVYWPGMNASIRNFRECCIACRTVAPSLPQEPLMPSPQPEWPFQAICMDFLETLNHSYLACADRYSGWLIVYKITPDTRALKSACRAIFSTYGAPEELSSDGGTMFTSHDFQAFLQDWGVEHRLSSAHYPQSNGRAELAVKTAKRILMGNTGPSGNLDNDKFARAIMEYRNTPLPDGGPSPAQLLLHRQIRDFLPSHPSLLKPHVQWIAAAKRREKVAAAKTCRLAERYNLHAKNLPPLQVGQHVVLQNQYGPRMRRWDRTGRIVECLGPRQYRIRLDGSGRITIRNRRFLRLTHTQGAPNPPNNPPPAPGLLLAQPAAPQQHPPVVPPNPPRPQSLGTRSHQSQSLARVARPALPQHLPQRPALPQRQPQHPTLVPQQRPHAPLPTTRSAPAQPAGMVRPQPPIMGHPLVTPPSTPRAGPPVSPSSQPRSPAPYSRPPMPRVLPAMNLQIPQSTPHVPSLPVTRSGKLPLALRRLQDFNVPGNSE